MKNESIEFLFMSLILPSLFGLTLIGEGLNKVLSSKMSGWVSIVIGFLFIIVVAIAYKLISSI